MGKRFLLLFANRFGCMYI